jgi:hypothetical protein
MVDPVEVKRRRTQRDPRSIRFRFLQRGRFCLDAHTMFFLNIQSRRIRIRMERLAPGRRSIWFGFRTITMVRGEERLRMYGCVASQLQTSIVLLTLAPFAAVLLPTLQATDPALPDHFDQPTVITAPCTALPLLAAVKFGPAAPLNLATGAFQRP